MAAIKFLAETNSLDGVPPGLPMAGPVRGTDVIGRSPDGKDVTLDDLPFFDD